ncbi:hypothetical protein [Eubacterium aggregans]|uniref:hypothetical protein n=1 Tax=Eubacterium aggregans TaxID=81409 RepID=UPI003F315040
MNDLNVVYTPTEIINFIMVSLFLLSHVGGIVVIIRHFMEAQQNGDDWKQIFKQVKNAIVFLIIANILLAGGYNVFFRYYGVSV